MGENGCALPTYLELKVLDAHRWRTSSIIPVYLSAHILSQPSLSRYFTWLCLACWSHERAFPQVATFLELKMTLVWTVFIALQSRYPHIYSKTAFRPKHFSEIFSSFALNKNPQLTIRNDIGGKMALRSEQMTKKRRGNRSDRLHWEVILQPNAVSHGNRSNPLRKMSFR
jgi:hypothetical protein